MRTTVHNLDSVVRLRLQSVGNGDDETEHDDEDDSRNGTGLRKGKDHANDDDSNPQPHSIGEGVPRSASKGYIKTQGFSLSTLVTFFLHPGQ